GERVVRDVGAERGLSYCILRPGAIYGPRSGFWTRKLFRLARRRPGFFPAGGRGAAPVIHVDDLVDLCITAATHPGADEVTFNATADPAPTWREFLGYYSRLAGHGWLVGLPMWALWPVAYGRAALAKPQTRAKDTPDLLVTATTCITYKITRAREQIGWTPSVSLEDGVQRCAPWLRELGLLD
ncbi:MAG: NAD(P)-dependent oxidoreductase, partial [Chloroflexi bacterium]|nr:NAD(P)-dependent oxidoreductase [Chloroflexota bacterium]